MQYDLFQPSYDGHTRVVLTFEGRNEIDTVAYAYSEHIRALNDIGNPSSVSDFDRWMANPNTFTFIDSEARKSVKTHDEQGAPYVGILQQFVDNTEEAVAKIWATSEPAMYAGIDADIRERMAQEALGLIRKIGRYASVSTQLEDTQEAVDDLLSGLTNLLANPETSSE